MDNNTTEYIIPPERMAHMYGVAEYCYRHASDPFYGLDPREMYVLGLLHDIGYLDGKSHHEASGGILMQRLGYKDYMEVSMHGDLLSVNYMADKKLILLIEADLKVDMSSEEVGYEKRLEGIEKRHGRDSRAYLLCKRNINFLRSMGR